MASILKRKYMPRTALNKDFTLPTRDQQIAQIKGTKGSQLHEVRTADGATILVTLPAKLRKRAWVKCGHYVVIEPINEGKKVKGEVVDILSKEHIVFLHQEGVWPEAFTAQEKQPTSEEDLWRNPNRPVLNDVETSDSGSSEDDEDSSENEECPSEDEDCRPEN